MKILQRSVLLISLGSLLIGCGVRPPIQPRADPYLPSQVHMDQEQLRKDTAVGTPMLARDEISQNLVVTVPIRSAINKTLYVDYYVTFVDASGVPVGPKLGPMTKVLLPNTPDRITVTSTTPRAVDFQVDFRYAR
jgi:uncharacterized protein YcfL